MGIYPNPSDPEVNMALRAQANLTISFGLVNIGVGIQKMIQDDAAPEGHLFCAEHHASVKQQYVCASHGEVVDKLGMVTGYEFGSGTVYLDDSDKKQCECDKDKRIALTHFVPTDDIDPLYFERSYIVWPQKGHEDGYALIQDALMAEAKALVGKVTLNKTTRMMVLRWSENTGTLVAHLCNYEANVRREHLAEAQAKASKEADPAMAAMVATILGSLEPGFDPENVTDEYNDRLRDAIKAKATGEEFTVDTPGPEAHLDFLAALKAQVATISAEDKVTA